MSRTFLILVLLSAAMRSVWASPLAGSRPNVIFIITDDQGYGDFSCHGNPVLKTPHLDRLHAEGARFTDFLVSPTCAPTRAALMTGRHEFKSGVTHTIDERERLALTARTSPQMLKDAGYKTGIFGKWHLGDEDEYQPQRRGFDEVYIHGAGGIGQSYPGSCGDAPGNRYQNPVIRHNGTFVKTEGYCTDLFFSRAMEWMSSVKDRPFYCHIATNAPHAPLDCRPEDAARYAGKVPPDAAKFFGMIANIDDNVGKLLAWLDAQNLTEKTLVIFMNDNGGTVGCRIFNAGMRSQKCTPWRGGVRAASFWRWPGRIQPGDRPQAAAHLDFFPTLSALCSSSDNAADSALEGRSLLPVLEDAAAVWEERTFFTHVGRWRRGKAAESKYLDCSVQQGPWTLVCAGTDEEKKWSLFDLRSDPGQSRDVAGQFSGLVAELDRKYDEWWQKSLPGMVNEEAVVPAENAWKTAYIRQFRPPGN